MMHEADWENIRVYLSHCRLSAAVNVSMARSAGRRRVESKTRNYILGCPRADPKWVSTPAKLRTMRDAIETDTRSFVGHEATTTKMRRRKEKKNQRIFGHRQQHITAGRWPAKMRMEEGGPAGRHWRSSVKNTHKNVPILSCPLLIIEKKENLEDVHAGERREDYGKNKQGNQPEFLHR